MYLPSDLLISYEGSMTHKGAAADRQPKYKLYHTLKTKHQTHIISEIYTCIYVYQRQKIRKKFNKGYNKTVL